jgi:hypothetical protein
MALSGELAIDVLGCHLDHVLVLFILENLGEKAIFMLLSLPYHHALPTPRSKRKKHNISKQTRRLMAVTARKREIMTPLRRLAHSRRWEQETQHVASSHPCHHPFGEGCSRQLKLASSQQKEACTRRDWADLLHPAYQLVV